MNRAKSAMNNYFGFWSATADGFWNLVRHGGWNLVFGIWFLEFGI